MRAVAATAIALAGVAIGIGEALDRSQGPPQQTDDQVWLQRVLVAAGFWNARDVDRRAWYGAISTGGPSALYVWSTEGNDGGAAPPRISWYAQGVTIWVEPVGVGSPDRARIRRLVEASFTVRRDAD